MHNSIDAAPTLLLPPASSPWACSQVARTRCARARPRRSLVWYPAHPACRQAGQVTSVSRACVHAGTHAWGSAFGGYPCRRRQPSSAPLNVNELLALAKALHALGLEPHPPASVAACAGLPSHAASSGERTPPCSAHGVGMVIWCLSCANKPCMPRKQRAIERGPATHGACHLSC